MHIENIINQVRRLQKKYGTLDPYELANAMGITIIRCDFAKQKGAYKVILKNRFIFLNDNLSENMERIVLCHELGHDTLHRKEAVAAGGFREFEIFNMQNDRMEYEANIFAAEALLSNDEFLDYCKHGYDTQQIAAAMNSDINLVAMKADALILQGFTLRPQEHNSKFLK